MPMKKIRNLLTVCSFLAFIPCMESAQAEDDCTANFTTLVSQLQQLPPAIQSDLLQLAPKQEASQPMGDEEVMRKLIDRQSVLQHLLVELQELEKKPEQNVDLDAKTMLQLTKLIECASSKGY